MIRVNDLQKYYGKKAALQGISFTVANGEIFGLLGPNGAGKTTTIKILTGQLAASGGEADINKLDVMEDKEDIRPIIGVVPEQTNLYERLTIRQNLEFFCRLYEVETGLVDEYLDLVGLLEEVDTQIKNLSKGMRQRVLLVRALLHKPEVLFLDEPTSGLDPSSASTIHNLLKELNETGMTILLTSHNMEEVDRLCHRVAFLEGGRIAAAGTPEDLKLEYANRQVRVLLQGEQGLEKQVLELDSAVDGEKIADWIRQGRLQAIHSCEPSLADIFIQVTGRDINELSEINKPTQA